MSTGTQLLAIEWSSLFVMAVRTKSAAKKDRVTLYGRCISAHNTSSSSSDMFFNIRLLLNKIPSSIAGGGRRWVLLVINIRISQSVNLPAALLPIPNGNVLRGSIIKQRLSPGEWLIGGRVSECQELQTHQTTPLFTLRDSAVLHFSLAGELCVVLDAMITNDVLFL